MSNDPSAAKNGEMTYHGTAIIVYTLGGTLFFIAAAATAVVYVRRKNKLNWFEKSVLDLSKGETAEVIRCRRGSQDRVDIDDDEGWIAYDRKEENKKYGNADDSREVKWADAAVAAPLPNRKISARRRQSRIYLTAAEMEMLAAAAAAAAASTSSEEERPVTQCDVTGKFFVPKTRDTSTTLSMFRGLDMTKIDRGLYDIRQDSALRDEQILGQCGSLHMGLNYDTCANLMTVKLVQAASLPARRTDDSPPNPYFKVHLIPSEVTMAPQIYESRRYKNVRSTFLGDEFVFDVPSGNFRGCQLEVLVYDFDEGASVDECIGSCWLSLNRVDVTDDPAKKTVFWAEILPLEPDEDTVGEIMFSTAYSTKAQRLTLTIIKARNLTSPGDTTEPPDPCVKVTVYAKTKKLKQRRTAVKKATYNPSFNETMTFNVQKNSLCDIVLSISVYHDTGAFRHGKILGRLQVPLHKCKDLWRALIRGEDSKATWHELEK